MRDHDSSYHDLFSHPEMLADLCQHFVDVPIYNMLDFTQAKRLDSKNISDKYKKRENDLCYKIPYKDGSSDAYVCMLLEFQSREDWC